MMKGRHYRSARPILRVEDVAEEIVVEERCALLGLSDGAFMNFAPRCISLSGADSRELIHTTKEPSKRRWKCKRCVVPGPWFISQLRGSECPPQKNNAKQMKHPPNGNKQNGYPKLFPKAFLQS